MKIQAEWLKDDFVQRVVCALGTNTIRFVGGAVRDTILKLPVLDIDAATILKPQEVINRLAAASIKVIPTGLKHGTITAVSSNQNIEITTLRLDVETDGRHAVVAYTDNWEADASRRDFTMNAVYMAPDGTVFDPFGGIEDAKAGRVYFIGDAAERIEEDALRILRFFRFQAIYGRDQLDETALKACKAKAALLQSLSSERICSELFKILAVDNPINAVTHMRESCIFDRLDLPVVLADLKTLQSHEKQMNRTMPSFVRLFCAVRANMTATKLSSQLKFSNKEAGFLKKLEALLQLPVPESEQEARTLAYRYGQKECVASSVCAMWPDQLLQAIESWTVPIIPVQGRDLLKIGIEAGPAMGETLKVLEALWLESDFSLTKDALLKTIRS